MTIKEKVATTISMIIARQVLKRVFSKKKSSV
jgi:hypothetical protein